MHNLTSFSLAWAKLTVHARLSWDPWLGSHSYHPSAVKRAEFSLHPAFPACNRFHMHCLVTWLCQGYKHSFLRFLLDWEWGWGKRVMFSAKLGLSTSGMQHTYWKMLNKICIKHALSEGTILVLPWCNELKLLTHKIALVNHFKKTILKCTEMLWCGGWLQLANITVDTDLQNLPHCAFRPVALQLQKKS